MSLYPVAVCYSVRQDNTVKYNTITKSHKITYNTQGKSLYPKLPKKKKTHYILLRPETSRTWSRRISTRSYSWTQTLSSQQEAPESWCPTLPVLIAAYTARRSFTSWFQGWKVRCHDQCWRWSIRNFLKVLIGCFGRRCLCHRK